jgi:hypothetical protein
MIRYLRLNYAYDKLASMKRQFVGSSLQVMCVGIAGTGARSRIRGHLRYGAVGNHEKGIGATPPSR